MGTCVQADRPAARTVVSRRLSCTAIICIICFVVSAFFFRVTALKVRSCVLNDDAGLSTITMNKSTAVVYAADDYLFCEDIYIDDSMHNLVSNEIMKVDIMDADVIEDGLIRPVKVGSDITGTDISVANRSAVISDADVVNADKISENIIFQIVIDAVIINTDMKDFDTLVTGSGSTHIEVDGILIECNIKFKTIKNRMDDKKRINVSKPEILLCRDAQHAVAASSSKIDDVNFFKDDDASSDKAAVLPVDNIDMYNAGCMFCVMNEVEGSSTTTAVTSAVVDYVTNDYLTCYHKSSDDYINHVKSIDSILVDIIVVTNVFDVDIICYCRIDTYTTDADMISDTSTDNKLNAISADTSFQNFILRSVLKIFVLGISMIMVVSLNSTAFKKYHPFTKMQAVKKWFVLFLLLSGDVSSRILNAASTTDVSSINETNENKDGSSSSLTRVALYERIDFANTMLTTTTTNGINTANFDLTTRLLATVTVSPSGVRAANNDAVWGDIIMITPGEVDLSTGELSVVKDLTFECTDPTTKCIFNAKASSSSSRRVIKDTHGKTATTRYVGLEITGGYIVR